MDLDARLQAATERAIAAVPHAWDWMPKRADKVLMIRLAQELLTALAGETIEADLLRPYVLAYWHGAVEQTKDASWSWEIAWAEFCYIWDHDRARARGSVQDIARQAATLPVPPELARYSDPAILLLGRACRLVATTRRDRGRFFMAGQTAGLITGAAKGTGAALLHLLCRDGILSPCDPPKHLKTAGRPGRRRTKWYVYHAVSGALRRASGGK